ncbi:hypothetical protein CC2G_010239 [Coprinopsis cinerea AmutBmut pab1-1]|nr:hypothetical protein CC2G_010239 [Coprinopsis cinerea AmutBmut pab1-1]
MAESAPINRAKSGESNSGVTAAELFTELSGGYESPHPSPPNSPKPAGHTPDVVTTNAPMPIASTSNQTEPKRKRPRIVRTRQPQAEELQALGIKVIDFAYVSTLPKVKPYYRQPAQSQPTPPGHKKLSREDTEPILGESSQQNQPSRPLRREDTEPVIEESSQAPAALPTARPLGRTVATQDIVAHNTLSPQPGPSALSPRPLPPFKNYSRSIVLVSPLPKLSLNTNFSNNALKLFDASPSTPVSPGATLITLPRPRRGTRKPSGAEQSITRTRTTRSTTRRTEAAQSTAPRYNLRSSNKKTTPVPAQPPAKSRTATKKSTSVKHVAQPAGRKRTRSEPAGASAAVTVVANCPTPKRPRTQPLYPNERPAKRARR